LEIIGISLFNEFLYICSSSFCAPMLMTTKRNGFGMDIFVFVDELITLIT
jgi:hypothetical protein